MNYLSKNAILEPAFVLKNFIPTSHKIEIFHRQYGKILCIYPRLHHASQLSTGSLILCVLEKKNNFYRFVDLSIEFSPHGFSTHQLLFLCDIARIIIKQLPREISAPELFDFLLYVYGRLSTLSEKGKQVVLLRIFMLLDLLPEQHDAYLAATQDPYEKVVPDMQQLLQYISKSWDNFYQYEKS